MNENQKKLILIASWIGITGLVYTCFRYVFPLVVPFLLALILAKVLHPIVLGMKSKWRISTKFGAPLVLILCMGILVVIIGWLTIQLTNQLIVLIRNIPVYWQMGDDAICNMCTRCDKILGWKAGEARALVLQTYGMIAKQASEVWLPFVTDRTIGFVKLGIQTIVVIFLTFVGALMLLEDFDGVKKGLKTKYFRKEIRHILGPVRKMSFVYAKAQVIIFCIVFIICAGGLFLLGNPYALVLGLLIAVIDAFPILGSGSVLVPWGILCIINGNLYQAAILLTCYVVTLFLREILESKWIGKRMGIHPFYLIVTMVLGVKLFGIAGVLLGPFGYLVIRETVHYISRILYRDTRPYE